MECNTGYSLTVAIVFLDDLFYYGIAKLISNQVLQMLAVKCMLFVLKCILLCGLYTTTLR